MAGKKWIAARVPDDKVVILPNVNVIREVNLNDTLNFLASPDIIEFAVKKGWYDPKSGKPFDFKKAYDKKTESPFTDKYNCDARQWRGQCLVTEKYIELPVNSDGLPFAVTPARKLTVMDMKRILSDHLEGTEFDLSNKLYENKNNLLPQTTICNAPKTLDNSFSDTLYKYINGSPHNLMNSIEGMICDKTHQEGAVFQLRNWLPAEIGCIYWRTTAAPCSSVLTPWYLGINQTPDAYRKNYKIEDNVKYDFHFNPPLGTFDYDPDKAFWIFNEVEVLTDINYGKLIRKVRPVYNNLENKIISSQQDVEKKALDLYKTDKAQARKFLTEYSADVAQQAISLAKNLIKELKTETMGF